MSEQPGSLEILTRLAIIGALLLILAQMLVVGVALMLDPSLVDTGTSHNPLTSYLVLPHEKLIPRP